MAVDHTWDPAYSADRGKMFTYWDPETKQEMVRSSWSTDFTYVPGEE